MKEVFVNHSINYLIRNNACSDKQVNIFRYTLESIYSFITKTTVVLFISLIVGTFKYTVLSLFLYGLLRGFTFGIHATKNIYCWITTLSVYLIFPLIIKYVTVPIIGLWGVNIIGVLAIILWAPADTPARPLLDKRKRITNKIFASILGILFLTLFICINNQDFREIISFIFILNTLCICPITYRLFHIRYNNYKYYKG